MFCQQIFKVPAVTRHCTVLEHSSEQDRTFQMWISWLSKFWAWSLLCFVLAEAQWLGGAGLVSVKTVLSWFLQGSTRSDFWTFWGLIQHGGESSPRRKGDFVPAPRSIPQLCQPGMWRRRRGSLNEDCDLGESEGPSAPADHPQRLHSWLPLSQAHCPVVAPAATFLNLSRYHSPASPLPRIHIVSGIKSRFLSPFLGPVPLLPCPLLPTPRFSLSISLSHKWHTLLGLMIKCYTMLSSFPAFPQSPPSAPTSPR